MKTERRNCFVSGNCRCENVSKFLQTMQCRASERWHFVLNSLWPRNTKTLQSSSLFAFSFSPLMSRKLGRRKLTVTSALLRLKAEFPFKMPSLNTRQTNKRLSFLPNKPRGYLQETHNWLYLWPASYCSAFISFHIFGERTISAQRNCEWNSIEIFIRMPN